MTNADVVEILEQTVRLLDLHDADPFRTKAFSSAAFNLDKQKDDFTQLTPAELVQLPGVGKSVANKIREIIDTGHLTELDELLAQTPDGVLAMFRIKGLGAKKIKVLWRELGVDTLADLKAACEAGQVATIKGFGATTQDKILHALAFLQSQQGKLRMDKARQLADVIHSQLTPLFGWVAIGGQVRRMAQEVDKIEFLIGDNDPLAVQRQLDGLPGLVKNEAESSPFVWRGQSQNPAVAVAFSTYPRETVERQLFISTPGPAHLAQVGSAGVSLLRSAMTSPDSSETAIYAAAGLPYIVPEMREDASAFAWASQHTPDELITWADLCGTLHNHSTYSDGKHTLTQMATYAQSLGLTYFGIADHSQTATYAQGLKPDDVRKQQAEIDALNAQFGPDFRILKGIESDILGDGSLDYDDEILATFDYVVASVHQTLTMTKEKATARLLRAIENPYTTILGHPTGRLLLSREGYPIDYQEIIKACAKHKVVIEINASPYRLDLDWRWIQYAQDQGAMLSINPDAHEMAGLLDMHYGVAVGRKGGLLKSKTFNALTLSEIEAYLANKKNQSSQETTPDIAVE
jgi:DNA polymerase (family X)